MRTALLASSLPLLLGLAQPPAQPVRLTVTLSSFSFDPALIRLHHGQPYVLHLVNDSPRAHNFVAPAFLIPAGAPSGAIEVKRGRSVDVAVLPPAPGRFPLKCTHFSHAVRGMRGVIIVD